MPIEKNAAWVTLSVYLASVVPPAAGFTVAALVSWPGYWIPLGIGLALAAGVSGVIWFLGRRGKEASWALVLAVVNLLVLTPESIVRAAGFRFTSGIEFGYPRTFQGFESDDDLWWTLPKGRSGVNTLGFVGPEVVIPKPAGVRRVLFLGDSVPAQGYYRIVEAELRRQPSGSSAESVNLSLAGYSSHQGRVLVDKYGAAIDPDVVVVSYGWNDHWRAYGATDSEKVSDIASSWPKQAVQAVYRNCHFLQWLRATVGPLLGADRPLDQVRVPLGEYVENLTHIGQSFAARGVPVVFVTPPTSHYVLGVPPDLVELGFAPDRETVMRLHRAYNDAVRDLTARNNWLLLDLENELKDAPYLHAAFLKDGIHLTEFGLRVLGRRIAVFIEGEELLRPPH